MPKVGTLHANVVHTWMMPIYFLTQKSRFQKYLLRTFFNSWFLMCGYMTHWKESDKGGRLIQQQHTGGWRGAVRVYSLMLAGCCTWLF